LSPGLTGGTDGSNAEGQLSRRRVPERRLVEALPRDMEQVRAVSEPSDKPVGHGKPIYTRDRSSSIVKGRRGRWRGRLVASGQQSSPWRQGLRRGAAGPGGGEDALTDWSCRFGADAGPAVETGVCGGRASRSGRGGCGGRGAGGRARGGRPRGRRCKGRHGGQALRRNK